MTREVRLTDHKYSQCHVAIDDKENIIFVSYRTPVILAEKWVDSSYNIWCTGTYSQTTRKQIGWFLREYFKDISYQDMKESAETGVIFTAFRN